MIGKTVPRKTVKVIIKKNILLKIKKFSFENNDTISSLDEIKFLFFWYIKIANTISVPADSSLSLIGKDNGFYLDETDLLAVTASANSDLTYLVSYELMKDA